MYKFNSGAKDNQEVLIDNEITLDLKSNLQVYDLWDFTNKNFKELNSAFLLQSQNL